MDVKHTPGPWGTAYRKTARGYAQDIFDAQGLSIATSAWYPVAVSETTTGTNREANAKFIVRACNSHAVLVEALNDYMSQFGQCLDAMGVEYTPAQIAADRVARAALALAGETS
jgi:hypothetical protein